jgi:hypothetical protein
MDKITASLATIPKRTKALKQMIDSISPQVDAIQVYLNGFEISQIPVFLQTNKKVNIFLSQEEDFGDRGDAGKFFNVQNIRGFHMVCDDDILYAKDYVQSMIKKCEQYNRKYVVGCHGGNFSRFPVNDAYVDRKNMAHYKKTKVEKDYLVHFLATNSVCFHDDTIQLDDDKDFKLPNMADIWMGLACQLRKVGMLCIAKEDNWLLDATEYDPWDSIFGHRYDKKKGGNADVQTKTVNTLKQWNHYE